jgi:hypothetical protein
MPQSRLPRLSIVRLPATAVPLPAQVFRGRSLGRRRARPPLTTATPKHCGYRPTSAASASGVLCATFIALLYVGGCQTLSHTTKRILLSRLQHRSCYGRIGPGHTLHMDPPKCRRAWKT